MANQPKKYKKFVATAATATLVASAIVPVASAKSFSDVPANNEFEPFIDALSDAGIINGYQDGTFKPGAKLTRGQVVKMLGRWVESNGAEVPADWNSVQRFNDVPVSAADQELVKYAALVKDAGVFSGSNGNLLAGNNITRQQMAKVLNGAFTAVNGTSLVDLADSIDNKLVTDLASAQQEFEGYIQALVDLGISTVSVFRPSENVTRAQFAKFLYNTISLDAAVSASVKAINNTTVEVTFEDTIDDIKALDFAIEGLEVKNAVIKQTDKKTAVLTTSPQTADVEYTVTVNDEEVGSFKGISAVIPTAIDVVTKSQQGKLGQQVTVQAKVKVPEGQSAAGIPVTFNVPSVGTLAPAITAESYTNAEGVATYTYTRYQGIDDTVVAYATGDRSKYSTGYVYWGVSERLAITEVTEGNELQDGSKKVYKVKATNPDGSVNSRAIVNIAFEENINVTPDKGTTTVTITDANGAQKGYPYQYSNNAKQTVELTLNTSGEATFTLTGRAAKVTPIVYIDGNASDSLQVSELQAKAPTVTFAAIQNVEVAIQSLGKADAAALQNGDVTTGGRDYEATFKTKDGKVLAEGSDVSVTLSSNFKGDVYLLDAEGKAVGNKFTTSTNDTVTVKGLKVGKDGKVKFTLTGSDKGYAQPIVFFDNNKNGVLNASDAQATGEYVYFGAAEVVSSELVVRESSDSTSKQIDALSNANTAFFHYQVTDQNGKKNVSTRTYVTYEVSNNGANTIYVAGTKVNPYSKESVQFQTDLRGHYVLPITSTGASSVTVNASSSHSTIANTSATVNFISSTEVPSGTTAQVASYDSVKDTIALGGIYAGLTAISYKGATIKHGAVSYNEAEFEALLKANSVTVKYTKDANGAVTLEITNVTPGTTLDTGATKTYVTNITATSTKDPVTTLTTGDTVTFNVTFSNAVSTSDVATLSLNVSGATAGTPTQVSTNVISFTYTVTSGQVLSGSTLQVTGLTANTANVSGNAALTTNYTFDVAGPTFATSNVSASAGAIAINFGEELFTAVGTKLATTAGAATTYFGGLDSATTATYNGSGVITINFSPTDLLAIRSGKVITFTGTSLLDSNGNPGAASKSITLAWNFVTNTIDVVGVN